MEEQNKKKDKESGKREEGGRSVSWEPLAESGLQMLCPPEDSQLLSILDGGHSNYSPPSTKIAAAHHLNPSTSSMLWDTKPWHHPCHGRSTSHPVTQPLCSLPVIALFLPLTFVTTYLLHFFRCPSLTSVSFFFFLSFNLLASALDQLGSGICLLSTC